MAAAMRAFGASQQDIDRAIGQRKEIARQTEKPYLVEHENWDALEIFYRMQTQWDIHWFTGQKIGMKYTPLIDVIKMFHPDNAQVIFSQVQLIEHGFLNEVNK